MSKRQLYKIIENAEIVLYLDLKRKIISRNVERLPFMHFPDGKACNLANLYMISLVGRGLADGSLRQYAANISHFVRYCSKNNISFAESNSDTFSAFIASVRDEKDPRYPDIPLRESNTVISIGRNTLDFLNYIGVFNRQESFIYDVIGAERKTAKIKTEAARKGYIETQFWAHKVLDTGSTIKRRGPIRKELIDLLYEASNKVTNSRYVYKRNLVLLRCMEMTGGRLSEIEKLETKDIQDAYYQDEPMLRLVTTKRKDEKARYIPVLKTDLNELIIFITTARKKLLKENGYPDNGYLLLSETTGNKLSARTLSNEVSRLRRAAQIKEKACAHMFRHRYITKMFITLIEQYHFENEGEFRRALLDVNVLKAKVQQYTGHKQLSSLDRYIDLAFKELSNFDRVVDGVFLNGAYNSFDEKLDRLGQELEDGMPVSSYLHKLESLIKMRDEDIERFSNNAKCDA